MFKPTHFRFQNSIQWPGAGPTTEIAADNIQKVETESDHFAFVHASGHAVKVPKAEVTAYGVYDADDVPNLPTSEDYKDDASKFDDQGEKDVSVNQEAQKGAQDSATIGGEGDESTDTASDKPSNDGLLGADSDIDAKGDSESDTNDYVGSSFDSFIAADAEDTEVDSEKDANGEVVADSESTSSKKKKSKKDKKDKKDK